MTLTEKCFPISRRNSMAESDCVQSRLETTRAAADLQINKTADLGPDPFDPVCDDVVAIERPFGGSPEGSPINPVAPPTSAIGRCHVAETASGSAMERGCPRGGSAQLDRNRSRGPSAPLARSAASCASSVVCATKPRHFNSSRSSLVGTSSDSGTRPSCRSSGFIWWSVFS